jgi:hypothetical protein
MYIGPVGHHFHHTPQTNQGELGQEISAAKDVRNADSSEPELDNQNED